MSFGIILLITGLIVSIAGATSQDKKKINTYNKQVKMKNEIPTKIIEPTSQDEALKTIRLRYAKGEISKEQFEQMEKDLEK
jgi:uncharacterized membrane protein